MSLTTKNKPKAYHRKIQGGHHTHSKRYLKPYWPYIPMLVIVFLGIGLNGFIDKNSQVLSDQTNFSRASLLSATNADRATNHDNPLNFSSELNSAAQAKANDMVNSNYWSHVSPSGKTPWSFITSTGYTYQAAAENLAYGFSSSSAVISAWMNSPGHRTNMLNNNYENVGFGIAESNNYLNEGAKVIVVAEYAEPIIAVPNTSGSTTSPIVSVASAQPVSRVQLLAGSGSAYLLLLVTALTGAAIAALVIRHAIYLKRLLSRSESYIVHHPLLDITIVFIITAGIILTRTVGIIN
jgi:hypothetical protein